MQVIWLLMQGHSVGATFKVTALETHWIEQLLERKTRPGSTLWPTEAGTRALSVRPIRVQYVENRLPTLLVGRSRMATARTLIGRTLSLAFRPGNW